MFAAAGIAATPASADDMATCTGAQSEPNARLQACERLIATGKYRGPNLVPIYNWRGRAYFDLGEYDRAIAELSEAIRLDPKRAIAYAVRGIAYTKRTDYDRAIADLEQAMQLDPKSATADYYTTNLVEAYGRRGLAFEGNRDFDRALADYDQAIRILPNDAIGAYRQRGLIYRTKGDYDRAIADLNQVIRIKPGDIIAYVGRATAYGQKGDYDRAMADFDQAFRLDPNYQPAFNNRGLVYNLMGQPDRALTDLNEAIRLNPKVAATYKNRGLSYEAKAEFDRALAEFRMALSIDPNQQEAKDGLARVAQRAAAPAGISPTAQAGSVRQLFERHQLLGTWAPDCGKPVSAQNLYLVVRPLDEQRVQLDRMEGPTARHTAYAAETATEPQPSELGVQVVGLDGPSALTFRVQSGQLLAFQSWHRKCG